MIGDAPDGAASRDGRVMGTYIHGCFASDAFRRPFSPRSAREAGDLAFEATVEETLDALAEHLAAPSRSSSASSRSPHRST